MALVVDPETGRRIRRGGRKYRFWLRQNYVPFLREMILEPSGCRRFAILPGVNPVTKRIIEERGKIAARIRKQCAQDGFTCPMWQSTKFLINPLTNRSIEKGGITWRRLLKTCAKQNLCKTWSTVGKKTHTNPLTGRHATAKTSAKIDRQCPKGSTTWGVNNERAVRSRCGNTNAARQIGYALRVGKSTIPGAGRGLFSVEGFKKGDTITEYDGEVIDIDVAERRRRIGQSSHIRSLASGRLAIDGRNVPAKWGHGGASFINDARDPRNINSKFCNTDTPLKGLTRKGIHVPERTWVRATKDILPGQEIFASYGRGYWKS